MPLDTVVKSLKGTKKEILEAVRARTVTVPRKVSGAQLQDLFASTGVLGFIKDTADKSGTYSPLRDSCILFMARFQAGGEIDFSSAEFLDAMTAVLDSKDAKDLIKGSKWKTSAAFAKAIYDLSKSNVPEYPTASMADIVAILEPGKMKPMATNEIEFHGVSDILILTVGADLPEMINAFAEISHDGKVWQRVQTTGLNRILEAGQYVFRVNHGVLILPGCKIRVTMAYTVEATIA